MDNRETTAKVLARIPDLHGAGVGKESAIHRRGGGPSASMGRILGQALSFKLLAGVALGLMAAAILPLLFATKSRTADSPSTNDLLPSQANTSDTGHNASVAPPKATLVRAMPEKASAPGALGPPPPAIGNASPSFPKDEATMSNWPNPAYGSPAKVGDGHRPPEPRANRPMTVRPPDYQADSRNADPPAGPAPGLSEDPNQNSANRNPHESTRSSVH
jgi:hypothetical protein